MNYILKNNSNIYRVFLSLMRDMRCFTFFTLLFLITSYLSAQKLTGIVYDRVNQEPVLGAHVYLDGSSLYDVTNAEGKFEITVNAQVNLPLIIYHFLYDKKIISNPFSSLPDTIFVDEKENLLNEVIVQAGRYSRNQLLQAFRREFLGTSLSARSCIIENEDKIDVWFNSHTHILSASCEEPIHIHNRYLGYKLSVDMDKFEVVYPGQRLNVGTPLLINTKSAIFFEDLAPSNKTIAKRREQVFEGSASHFLRALAQDTTDFRNELLEKFNYWLLIKGDRWVKKTHECFKVINMNGVTRVLVKDSLLKPKSLNTYNGMTYYGTVQVQRAEKEETELIFFTDSFLIDAWGTPTTDILFSGYMGSLRFGDKLPANYGINTSVPSEYFTPFANLTIEDRLKRFMDYFPTEKIYIHQDRTRYMAGETVWFKAYRDFSKKDDPGSNILYVDLINTRNQRVMSSQWMIESDMAFGQFALPDTLPSGNYQLSTYTRWMQNPGMENYFTREIQVYSSKDKLISGDNQSLILPSVELNFFPEGGYLVKGIPSKIAFKVVDNQGNGLNASGVVIDQDGNEIHRFQTQHNGMGAFSFEPQPEKQYSAKLDIDSGVKDFPIAQEKGIVMEMKHEDDWIHLTLRHNLNISLNDSSFYLTIHQKGNDYYTTNIDMTQSQSVLHIPISYLPNGIFTITVYDKYLKAYCERLAFVKYPEPVQLHVSTDLKMYGRRKKVTVQVKATDKYNFPQSGNFSLAVARSELEDSTNRNDFYSDYFLQSEIKGRIENPASYFDKKDSEGLEKLDLLLLTSGWRRYKWDDMISSQKPEIQYPIEKSLSLSGKVEMGKSREDQVNVTALLRLDDSSEVISGHPEANGKFGFTGFEFYNTAELLLSAMDHKNKLLNITIEKPVFPAPAYFYPLIKSPINQDSHVVELFGTMPVISGNMENTIYELPEVMIKATRIRGNKNQFHDSSSSLAVFEVEQNFSYTSVGSKGAMAILDYIPQMRRLQIGGRTFIHVIKVNADGSAESTTGRGEDMEPYYILDGVRVDRRVIESTPASNIARVELVYGPLAMVYGSGAFAGAVIFHSKNWIEMSRSRPVKTILYQFVGYNQEKEFYSPNYSLPQNENRSDYRNTLYWQPNVILGQDGKAEFSFFTSDERGEYIIHCEGISTMNDIGVCYGDFSVD